jgi:hypothetical protein
MIVNRFGREVLSSAWVDGGVCAAEVTLCPSYHSSGHYKNRNSGDNVTTPSLTTPDTPAHCPTLLQG